MALTAPKPTKILDAGARKWNTFPVAADAIIFPGAIVARNAAGYLVPGSAAVALETLGIAIPKEHQLYLGGGESVDATDKSNGDLECEVEHCIALCKNSAAADEITIADVGHDCYVVDDETVAKTAGGTLQVTDATLTFNGTDEVGLFIDGVLVAVPCNTNAATTIDNWLVEAAKYPSVTAAATLTDGTTKVTLSFKTPGAHSVVDHSPATASFAVSHTTPGVAATRPVAGKVWQVDSQGVWVDMRRT